MAQYKVVSYDVWGNERDGYEVNAAYNTSLSIDVDDIDNDEAIVEALVEIGYLDARVNADDISITGDEYCLYLLDTHSSYPLGELQLKQD